MSFKRISTCPICGHLQHVTFDVGPVDAQCNSCLEDLTIIPLVTEDCGWVILTLNHAETIAWQTAGDFRTFKKWLVSSREAKKNFEDRRIKNRMKAFFQSVMGEKIIGEVS